jgi:hypothetical protein
MMNDPFARLPVVPNFTLTSTDVADGQELPVARCRPRINAGGHLLGRAVLIPWAAIPAS